ncbi:RidA family protein [Jiangella anatolica]|uniref:RidA family protein n=1 Tax=Jiangella anatolica TaxID=2670374 RepID=UPI00131455B9|nr:RidA family protein [Jiangella anatolica]
MLIEHIEPDPENPPPIPLSSAVRVGRLLFVSGQVSTEPGQGIVADTFDGEFHRTIRNVEQILAAAGATLRDVVQVRAFLRDEEARPRFNQLYAQTFQPPYPARTTVGNHFSFIQVEIDCVAVLPDGADPTV